MKAVKKYFMRQRILETQNLSLLRTYPKSFHKIGIVSKNGFEPDTNFITKLKIGFGNNLQIFIFVLEGHAEQREDYFNLNISDINLLGQFKKTEILEQLKNLDLLIDMTQTKSILKTYAFNFATKAYKITLGQDFYNNCNLTINLNQKDQDLFADEIIKYHNILGNVQK